MPTREAEPHTREVDVDQVVALPVDQLHPAEDNPRVEVGDVAELAASIAAVGLLQTRLERDARPAGEWGGDG